jgi:hypothetical protein
MTILNFETAKKIETDFKYLVGTNQLLGLTFDYISTLPAEKFQIEMAIKLYSNGNDPIDFFEKFRHVGHDFCVYCFLSGNDKKKEAYDLVDKFKQVGKFDFSGYDIEPYYTSLPLDHFSL